MGKVGKLVKIKNAGDDPPPLVVGRIGFGDRQPDAIDRLRSLSEAAEERAVEEFKERLLSVDVVDVALNGHPEAWRETIEGALYAAIKAAEKGDS